MLPTEAVEHKIEMARLRMLGTTAEYNLVWNLKRRLEKAEAKIASLSSIEGK